ncbi:hypothetical protein GCM10009530_69640 [Microbispora corallina]|uniref:Major facilitator superfamily (MFS) profile domain-containing protein n=1 Tax=Microbispora corallina TaxID=83302 RepID=A0ABQ4G395_9ACTN|nr:MFS transporter [Microbispora corallina]GIH41515.1 hypothetical protein Mco01_45150 [Microbispora corallina]
MPIAPRTQIEIRRTAGRPSASHHAGFWFAAVAFAVQMGFGTAPTPLWPLYEAGDGLGPTTVTVAFALLMVGAAASFRTLGHLSDRHGRRRVIVLALLTATAATLVLLAWPSLPGLLAGRLLTGVALEMPASTATTHLSDLYGRAHPRRPGSGVPDVVATAAMIRERLGIGAPLAGGLPGFVTFLAAAGGRLALGHAAPRRILLTGLALFPAGLALVAVSLGPPALWLYLLASAAAGAGAGLLFKGVLAVFFVVAYAVMGLQAIGFGVANQGFGLLPSMIGFAVLLSAGAAASVAALPGRAGA